MEFISLLTISIMVVYFISLSKLEGLKRKLSELVSEAPELATFVEYVEKAEATKALDKKTKKLMSLAIGIAIRCEPCILWHCAEAVNAGATLDEILDTVKVAVCMGGGPALAYSVKAYEIAKEIMRK